MTWRILTSVAVIAACAPAPLPIEGPRPVSVEAPVSDQAPASPDVSKARPHPRDDSSLLPAGIYFRQHTYMPCVHLDEATREDSGLCNHPTAAVVLGVYDQVGEAQAAIAGVASLDLPLGYPLAAHTDELGLVAPDPKGIAVVLGLFRDPKAARQWQATLGDSARRARVAPLLSAEAAGERLDDASPMRRVVTIEPGEPVLAYPRDQIYPPPDNQRHDWTFDPTQARPSCRVQPGSLFLSDGERMPLEWYQWAPVRCGGELAFVPWTRTLLLSSIWRHDDGSYRIVQQTLAECDVPYFETWTYTRAGRDRGTRRECPAQSGCGG